VLQQNFCLLKRVEIDVLYFNCKIGVLRLSPYTGLFSDKLIFAKMGKEFVRPLFVQTILLL